MISAKSVNRSYGSGESRFNAVQDLDLHISAGERVSIIGRSGSGKSTLLNLLAGLDQPSSGTLTVDSSKLHELSRQQMADYRLTTIGVIFQAFQLIPQRTALQNVELPLIMKGVAPAERRLRATEWLRRVRLDHRASHFPYQMSGGEQQRVAIARALVNEPPILLADEPTGNLDSSTTEEVVNLLTALCDESDVTFVLVTHDEPLADRFGHRKLRMSDGVLSEVNS
jgi:ABC-type lipoprotein export system ATPase subunit